MAYGFKSGGRKKGVKNKRTQRIESAAKRLLDDAKEFLGDKGAELFAGDAHALLVLTYKNSELPLDIRLDAAKTAIRFEKAAMASSTVDLSVKAVRADQLSDDELAAIAVSGARQLPSPSDEPIQVASPSPDEAVK
jgi:hypothetical protein